MLRKSSQNSSAVHRPLNSRDRSLEMLIRLAGECRRLGLKVGSSQIEEAARLYETYLEVGGVERDDYRAMRRIAEAVFIKRTGEEPLFEEAWRKISPQQNRLLSILISRVERNLEILGVNYGYKIRSKRELLESASRGRRAEKRRAYRELRNMGIITGSKHGEQVLPRDKAIRMLRGLVEKKQSLGNIMNAGLLSRLARGLPPSEPALLAETHIPEDTLRKLHPDLLVKLGQQALKAHNKDLASQIASHLRVMLEHGKKASSAYSAYMLMRAANKITPKTALILLTQDQRLASHVLKDFSLHDIRRALSSMKPDNAARIISRLSKASSTHSLREMLSSLDVDMMGRLPSSLASILSRDEQALIKALRKYYEARRMILEYLSSSNEAYLHLASHEYSRMLGILAKLDGSLLESPFNAMFNELRRRMRILGEVLRASENSVGSGLAAAASMLGLGEAIRLLGKAYSRGSPELRQEALRLARRMIRVRMSREKSRILRRWRKTSFHGRLELRDSIIRLVRLNAQPLIYRKRRKGGRIVLVLDASGSMLEYSIWALLVASAFADMIKRVIVFREYSESLETSRLSGKDIINLLFSIGFEGYTNIAGALRDAVRRMPPSTLILISDLHQTTLNLSPYMIVGELVRKGWRIVAVVPPRHDEEEAEMLRRHGARVEIVEEPSMIGRRILRAFYA